MGLVNKWIILWLSLIGWSRKHIFSVINTNTLKMYLKLAIHIDTWGFSHHVYIFQGYLYDLNIKRLLILQFVIILKFKITTWSNLWEEGCVVR